MADGLFTKPSKIKVCGALTMGRSHSIPNDLGSGKIANHICCLAFLICSFYPDFENVYSLIA